MNITWPNFNRNQLILLVSGGIIVLLLMYALLRDSTDTISSAEASRLIQAGPPAPGRPARCHPLAAPAAAPRG